MKGVVKYIKADVPDGYLRRLFSDFQDLVWTQRLRDRDWEAGNDNKKRSYQVK
jgi:hypothetical protein